MEKAKENNGTFEDLSLKENLLRGIYSYGFEVPSAIQSKAIPVIKSTKDVIAQAQSGTGKTGAFVIGSLERVNVEEKATQIIIISPTRELSKQTTEVVGELGKYMDISYMEVVGGTDVNKCREGLDKSPQIIIGTPGRILDMVNKNNLYTNSCIHINYN